MSVEKYGKTQSEQAAARMFQCREIVQEIVTFGVTQSQIIRIIKLLALEIENHNDMQKIVDAVKLIESADNDTILKPTNNLIL